MTAASAVADGQVAADALMTDTCTITRAATGRTFNTTTGQYTANADSTIYTGSCRVKPNPAASTVQAGDRQVTVWPYTVSVPIAVDDVELNDKVTVTSSADPALTNIELRIRAVARGTYLTARRLDCEDYQ